MPMFWIYPWSLAMFILIKAIGAFKIKHKWFSPKEWSLFTIEIKIISSNWVRDKRAVTVRLVWSWYPKFGKDERDASNAEFLCSLSRDRENDSEDLADPNLYISYLSKACLKAHNYQGLTITLYWNRYSFVVKIKLVMTTALVREKGSIECTKDKKITLSIKHVLI